MQKRKKSKISSLDREEITSLIDDVNKLENLDHALKEKILNYLLKIVDLSMDVEHSKISISKLKKLFGFVLSGSTSKEV
jgi:hypothetical protein